MSEFSVPPAGYQEDKSKKEEPVKTELPKAEDLIKDINLSEEDKFKFFECIMKDEPYSEEVSVMGDTFRVVFRDRTTEEMEAIGNQISEQNPDKVVDWDRLLYKYVLCFALVSIRVNSGENGSISLPFEDIEKSGKNASDQLLLRAEIINKYPQAKYFMLLSSLLKFNAKVEKLTKECSSPDFSLKAVEST